MKYDVIHALSYLLHDPQAACRENLHLAYKHLAQVPSGRLAVGTRVALGLLSRSGLRHTADHSPQHSSLELCFY